jgi:exodeoxyribonuclease V alpha subunit
VTTHLSTRITWHDRGWDGHVCDCPVENSSCLVHQHVRESRDDKLEMDCRATALHALDGWLPPCSRDINAFSANPFQITHRDPLDWRALPPVDEDVLPCSVCPAPYRWMREEHLADIVDKYQIDVPPPDDRSRDQGWVNEPKRQRLLLKRFWDELEVGRSLIFFYCNHGNPLESGPSRLLVGASRISEVGTQLMFGKKPSYGADHPVWSRRSPTLTLGRASGCRSRST